MAFEDRLKLFVTSNHQLVRAVLLVGAIGCLLGGAYIFAVPSTQTVTEEQYPQTFATEGNVSAVAVQSTPLYDDGERLENRSLYFLNISPQLTITMNTSLPQEPAVTLDERLRLEIRGLRDGESFYRSNRTLLDQSHTVRSEKDAHQVTANMSAVAANLADLRQTTGPAGEFRVYLVYNSSYESNRYRGWLNTSAPVVVQGQAYYVDGTLETDQAHSLTRTRKETTTSSPTEYGGLAVIGLLLGGLTGVISRVKDHSNLEVLRTNITHDQHQEWISRGEFPTDADKEYISIMSLADLVDVAIDSSRRVLYDPQIEAYAVIDGSEIYYYAVDGLEADEWFDI